MGKTCIQSTNNIGFKSITRHVYLFKMKDFRSLNVPMVTLGMNPLTN
jgi:hypothetical protein